ncbi:hypothetical protein P775_00310 [Puniceibacterium antarcticum]|uniref:Uncharacterized protein n=1 Tax=Puniceibacterium antarcticum TaxID=1206336 RepID=A0A2G8RL13_9RHOB|nr:hypothetical protein P775_00310 [Puniceibacterium antarcticum]
MTGAAAALLTTSRLATPAIPQPRLFDSGRDADFFLFLQNVGLIVPFGQIEGSHALALHIRQRPGHGTGQCGQQLQRCECLHLVTLAI